MPTLELVQQKYLLGSCCIRAVTWAKWPSASCPPRSHLPTSSNSEFSSLGAATKGKQLRLQAHVLMPGLTQLMPSVTAHETKSTSRNWMPKATQRSHRETGCSRWDRNIAKKGLLFRRKHQRSCPQCPYQRTLLAAKSWRSNISAGVNSSSRSSQIMMKSWRSLLEPRVSRVLGLLLREVLWLITLSLSASASSNSSLPKWQRTWQYVFASMGWRLSCGA
mmetsp:Transcript_103044/g.286860  ORF Transcript_103044/g.286860 Transcript_103044/m.286860 type:complete len:220 (+) Transcript_103044:62-721(+)